MTAPHGFHLVHRSKRFAITQKLGSGGQERPIAEVKKESKFSSVTAFLTSAMTAADNYFIHIGACAWTSAEIKGPRRWCVGWLEPRWPKPACCSCLRACTFWGRLPGQHLYFVGHGVSEHSQQMQTYCHPTEVPQTYRTTATTLPLYTYDTRAWR